LIVDALRGIRAAVFWLAGPLDRIWLSASGRGHLPPLWLRRHTGPIANFESSAHAAGEFIDRLGLLTPGDRVLDIGCGAGAMVPELARRLGPEGRYIGFDVHRPSIRWCRKHYAANTRFAFDVAAVTSVYGAASGPPATRYSFPIGAEQADFILAKSVFTHLLERDARHYLAEIRRALKPGRGAMVTAFLFDASQPGGDAARRVFAFGDAAGHVRWRSRTRPAAAVAYEHSYFREMVEAAGLHVQWMSPGFFPGSDRVTGQDTLLLGH
jgi:ubiquinone/menaquinone biosynthesis C-methylase UbiE